jgi:peptidyl-prolyl cis-trans isomerase SurA
MRILPIILRTAGPFLVALATTSNASASVVERVVAVVGEQALLLSELRERAKPFLLQLGQQAEDEAHRAAATSQLYARLLQRMVEDELEQKAANRANLTITASEIEDALTRIANQNGVPVTRVVEEATKSGLTEVGYRQELRRQLLEAKLLNLRIQGRLRVSEDDIRTAYQKLVIDERRQLGFRAAWIRIAAPRTLDAKALRTRRSEADRIVSEARTGGDFAALARRHSVDTATKESGGFLGRMKPGQLPPALDSVALGLDSGAVSEPVRYGDDFVILKMLGRDESQLPPFEEAKDELSQRVYLDKMNKARQHWMEGLRRQTHVEIRL